MTIMFYTHQLIRGGAERAMVNLANMFSVNHKVIFVTQLEYKNEYKMNNSIKRHNMDTLNKIPFRIDPLCIRRIFQLRKVIKEEKPDVIITFLYGDGSLIYRAKLFLKIPHIISNRVDPYLFLTTTLSKIKTKALYSLVDGCVFQTNMSLRYFHSKIQKKSTVIDNLIDIRLFNTIPNIDRKGVVGVGRLYPGKGWDVAIRAFSLISDKTNENFYIYGEGEEYDKLNDYIAQLNLTGRVILAGVTDDIEEIVAGSKLFLFASEHEGLPNALIEALVLGVPCISTRFSGGGAEKLIESGENGLLVQVGDFVAMAEAILKVLNDDEYANSLGQNATERTHAEFNPEQIFAQWNNYIIDISNNYKKRNR